MSAAHAPPQDLRLESAVLACAMLDQKLAGDFADMLRPDDFYAPSNAAVASAIVSLVGESQPVDTLTVQGKLEAQGTMSRVGLEHLLEITNDIPHASRLEAYARRLRELAQLRRWQNATARALAESYEPMEDVDGWMDRAEADMARASADRVGSVDLVTIRDAVSDVFERIAAQGERKTSMTGHACGIKALDDRLMGFSPGELIIIAGRPGMGKSALAINNIALGIARPDVGEGSLPVLIFNLEMGVAQQTYRMLAAESGVDGKRVLAATLTGDEWPDLVAGAGRIADLPILFHPVQGVDVATVRRQARRAQREHGQLGAIVLDYVGLMKLDTGAGNRNKSDQLGDITRGFKLLAQELQVPFFLLSQLNRSCEQRPDKRPNISDLRDSGAIEQDADRVLMVYRPSKYEEGCPDPDEIIIGKNRPGETGTCYTRFVGKRTCFMDCDYHQGDDL